MWTVFLSLLSPAYAVTGGSAIDSGQWPDLATFWVDNAWLCHGVLVAPDVVLTTTLCVPDADADAEVYFRFETGSDTANLTQRGINGVLVHPGGDGFVSVPVLVFLDEEVVVEPRRLAIGCAAADIVDGAPFAIVGTGATDVSGTGAQGTLHMGETTITDADCSDDVYCADGLDAGSELIAGGDGVGACFGDAGSPGYVLTEHGNYVVGLADRGASGNTSEEQCGQGDIYVRVDAYREWIEAQGVALVEPTCGEEPDDTEDPGGCGCRSTTPLSGALALPVLALGLRRRQGRRDK